MSAFFMSLIQAGGGPVYWRPVSQTGQQASYGIPGNGQSNLHTFINEEVADDANYIQIVAAFAFVQVELSGVAPGTITGARLRFRVRSEDGGSTAYNGEPLDVTIGGSTYRYNTPVGYAYLNASRDFTAAQVAGWNLTDLRIKFEKPNVYQGIHRLTWVELILNPTT